MTHSFVRFFKYSDTIYFILKLPILDMFSHAIEIRIEKCGADATESSDPDFE